jgi:hypothetical protein
MTKFLIAPLLIVGALNLTGCSNSSDSGGTPGAKAECVAVYERSKELRSTAEMVSAVSPRGNVNIENLAYLSHTLEHPECYDADQLSSAKTAFDLIASQNP